MIASIAIATLSIAGTVTAAPAPGEPNTLTIPLHKRDTFLTERGVVVASALARQVSRVQVKYARGNAAYKAKTGLDLFSVPLININHPQYGPGILPLLYIQPRATGITNILASGSADLWVPSSSCTSRGCSPHDKYTSSESSTSSKKNGTFRISYADGTAVSGPIYSDTVTVAGLSAVGQYFSPVTRESSSFSSDPSDGIMGLAFSSISSIGAPTFIENLYSQGKISAPTFGLRLASSGSELYLGGADTSKYTGNITWALLTSKTYWLTTGSSSIGGVIGYYGAMIIDSGTTLIVGSTSSVKDWWAKVPGSKSCSIFVCGALGYHTYPCSSPPSVGFTFSGREFLVSPTDFNLGTTDESGTTCVGAIMGMRGIPDNTWVVGDTFMKSVYTIFDEANARVGFATPA
ncbi:unnamed protein product [Rhizoctonia solani]|uniref:Peptidase A1 domain-containing protein n=1 Tax=Rhizoctonia solani TaxID=456999 RepID=A0A8H3DI39_9AGAM|nr:unnamed protein product [Rhizoctonia solani]